MSAERLVRKSYFLEKSSNLKSEGDINIRRAESRRIESIDCVNQTAENKQQNTG